MIRINNLNVVYNDNSQAISNVDVNFPKVGFICLTGDSGSGKTTLLNCIYNNIAFTGSIEVNGIDVQSAEYARTKRNTISMIYQDYRLLENLTVEQNLRLSCEIIGVTFTHELLDTLLNKVGLDISFAKRQCKKLSGGEKQRIAIARALAQKSKIIMADEPTGNLDSRNAKKIFELFKSLSGELLILIVTHSHKLANLYSDYQVKLLDGRIIENTIVDTNIIVVDKQAQSDSTDDHSPEAVQPQSIPIQNKSNKLSYKSNLALIALPYKSKSVLIALTAFIIVFILIACLFGSMITIDYNSMLIKNAKQNDETIMRLSNDAAVLKNTFLQNDGLESACYSFKNNDYINGILPPTDEQPLDCNFMKYNQNFEWQNFIECDDIASIGGSLVAGRNVADYNEIVINESLAYYIQSIGSYDNKSIASYSDIMGCALGDFIIVGILSAQYDRIANKFKNTTLQDVINMSPDEQETATTAKHIIEDNNTINTHVIKVGYSEHTRDTYQSINTYSRKRQVLLELDSNRHKLLDYVSNSSIEYVNSNGDIINEPLQDNQVVLPKAYVNLLAPDSKFDMPYELNITLLYAINVIVVGYTEDNIVYTSSSFGESHGNKSARIYNAINFSSKQDIEAMINSFNSALKEYELKPSNQNNFLVVQSSFSTGIDSVSIFFESFGGVFLGIFIFFSLVTLLFGFAIAYILISRIKYELSILSNIGFQRREIISLLMASMGIIWLIATIILLALYYVVIAAFNAFFTNFAYCMFSILHLNFGIWILLSLSLLAVILTSTALLTKKRYKT